MAECDEESLYIVDSEGDHKQKSLVSCDPHRRMENGDQEVPSGDLMEEIVPKTNTRSSKLKLAPAVFDDSCSDQPMSETYKSAVYALRPELEIKVLVKNIISKMHIDAGGFLSDCEEDDVMAYPTNRERMQSLLRMLRTKSNKDFMTFYKALESSGYQHLGTELKTTAGIKYKPPQNHGPETAHKILKEKKVAYSLHPVIEKLGKPFPPVVSEFEKQVHNLSDDLYVDVVALCRITMAVKAHKSSLPDVPSKRKDFINHIIKHTTLFDIELIHKVANLLQQPTLTEAVLRYEAELEPLMRNSIAELTDRCEVTPTDQDSPEGTHRLVLKFPDDANVKDLYEAKDYLEKVLHIPDAKLLAFDFGCILAYFDITCTPDTLKDLPKKFAEHSNQLKGMGISGAFLIDHWAWGADSDDVWYTDDESDDMEVNDQQRFLEKRKRSHLGSVSGGCADIVSSKKASHLKENCPAEETGDRQGTAEEDCCSQPPHSPMPCTEEATSQTTEPEMLHQFDQLQTYKKVSKSKVTPNNIPPGSQDKNYYVLQMDFYSGLWKAIAEMYALMRNLDYSYWTNRRSSKLLRLSLIGKSSTQPVHRRLAKKRRNRLKAILSSGHSVNCHRRKSQRTMRTSHTSHTPSHPFLAQPKTSSVHSDSTDEVESTPMDQTDSGISNDL